MALSKLFILLIAMMQRASAQLTDCSTNGQSDCASDEYCSDFESPALCYSSFNATDYSSFILTTGSQADFPGTQVTGIDLTTLFDNDLATGISRPYASTTWNFFIGSFPDNGYWIHHIAMPMSIGSGQVRDIKINDVSVSVSPITGTLVTWSYTPPVPVYAKNVTFAWYQSAGTIYEFAVYGAYDSAQPTTQPTVEPTADTDEPTISPTNAPTVPPTGAPTAYPVPDSICQERVVNQSCCGIYDYTVIGDQLNVRDPTLTTCEYSFDHQCCGTVGGFDAFNPTNNIFYGCDGAYQREICQLSFFNTSQNATDDIYGEVISAEVNPVGNYTDFYSFFASESWRSFTSNPQETAPYCSCNWTVFECEGEDEALCGSAQDWDALFADSCWSNDTEWTEGAHIANETCYRDIVQRLPYYEHLTWSACSEEAFIGEVTELQAVESEFIFDGDCGCQYYIRTCDVYVHPLDRVCADVDDDGNAICGEEGCEVQVANPCCATMADAEYGESSGVTPELDAFGQPVDGSWTCDNANVTELCPDLWSGRRLYTAESSVQWWFDEEVLNSRCGCLYMLDECEFPPTPAPTGEPTTTESPTKAPSQSMDAGDGAERYGGCVFVAMFLMMMHGW
mmetsp:Transcript_52598/g.83774  ORF Transcript_52598/g.83774 Transcript_52598/m.83774 type:complete len:622 (-) Transcript_52598:161-2026(-)